MGYASGHDGSLQAVQRRLKDICRCAAEFYHRELMAGFTMHKIGADVYFAERKIDDAIIEKWMLGYARGGTGLVKYLASFGFTRDEMLDANLAAIAFDGTLCDRFCRRLMFPIIDGHGDVIAFSARSLEGALPKYIHSQRTPIFSKSLLHYGWDKAKAAVMKTKTVIVVEGYTDVIAMHEAGFENTMAFIGIFFTREQVRFLKRYAKRVVYMFDGDDPGEQAISYALGLVDELLSGEGSLNEKDVCVARLPLEMDPAEFLVTHGSEKMRVLIEEAIPVVSWSLMRCFETRDRNMVQDAQAIAVDLMSVLAPIKNSVIARRYARRVAVELGVDEEICLEALVRTRAPHIPSFAFTGAPNWSDTVWRVLGCEKSLENSFKVHAA